MAASPPSGISPPRPTAVSCGGAPSVHQGPFSPKTRPHVNPPPPPPPPPSALAVHSLACTTPTMAPISLTPPSADIQLPPLEDPWTPSSADEATPGGTATTPHNTKRARRESAEGRRHHLPPQDGTATTTPAVQTPPPPHHQHRRRRHAAATAQHRKRRTVTASATT
ncbi:hypothetical protein PAPYR_4702 [Paratrimastix pyriformis]|uniref:Uncharacterized protein n=1 Tax=Paratrimastix pyriformis TaxID=342808 RepID=A0ABQ8ULQ7_9EUKA|nr:hypothetical protein PAPYR_4702 [Paratrimastix pyriformis]